MATKPSVVHSDPDILGTPVFVGTRVPVQSLFDYLEGGDTLNESAASPITLLMNWVPPPVKP